jgi:hypothetical protein
MHAMTVHMRRGSVAPLITNLVMEWKELEDSRPSLFIPELKASVSHRKDPELVRILYPLHMTI